MICEKDFEAGARNMSTRSIFSIEEVYQSIKEEKNLTEVILAFREIQKVVEEL